MIEHEKIIPIIEGYKKYFPEHWKDEKYKWEAVKHFQENWDIGAENFGEMFKKATAKASNLLDSGHHYPRAMILNFAKADDKTTREMFEDLFDESRDLAERIKTFMQTADELKEKYNDGTWNNHFQNTNAASTYLWLKYPDKYYIYKYDIYRKCAEKLDDTYRPKGNGNAANVIGGYKMLDELRAVLMEDEDYKQMLNSFMTNEDYPDPEMITAAYDLAHYIEKTYESDLSEGDEWFPSLKEYTPGLSAEDWGRLLRDKNVFTDSALEIMKRMKDYGGAATCRQLSEIYGESYNFYNSGSVALARRVCEATDISPEVREDGSTQWWSMLYTGRSSNKDEKGSFVWKLRDELSQALDNFDLSGVKLYKKAVTVRSEIIISLRQLGGHASLKKIYAKIKERGLKKTTESSVRSEIQTHCNKTRSFQNRNKNKKNSNQNLFYPVNGLGSGVWGLVSDSSETAQVTDDDNSLDSETADTSAQVADEGHSHYTKADFLKEVFMTEGEYDRLRALILRKKNVILQGAPGVGKTFSAKRLAYSIIGEKNKNRVCMVQFHQNYSYEDFIMGYRPNDSGGFDLQTGVFYDFCERCKESCEPYFFIIDEINRGNLSKIFGELLMLIENDKRGEEHKINPVYGGKPFYIPENLHIIGMMNTADRSLAMIDYALRRRFCFYTMRPAFEDAQCNGFGEYAEKITCKLYHEVIAKIKDLNAAIRSDSALGSGFEIGHSYFAPEDTSVIDDEWVRGVVEFEIIPLIEEYWFDDDNSIKEWTGILRAASGDSNDG